MDIYETCLKNLELYLLETSKEKTKTLPLTQGYEAIVDFWVCIPGKWYVQKTKTRRTQYAVQKKPTEPEGRRPVRLLHHLVLEQTGIEIPENMVVDHINHSGLDNRLENLRIVTESENLANQPKYRNNTSGHKGVYQCKRSQKWIAVISFNKKRFYLGLFNSKNLAIEARKKGALKYYPETHYEE
jgi:hypothetical protein